MAKRPTPLAARQTSEGTSEQSKFAPSWARDTRSGSPTASVGSGSSPRTSDIGSMIASAALKASSPRSSTSPPGPPNQTGYSPRGVSPRGISPKGISPSAAKEKPATTSPPAIRGSPRASSSPRQAGVTSADMGALIASHAMSMSAPKRTPTWSRRNT